MTFHPWRDVPVATAAAKTANHNNWFCFAPIFGTRLSSSPSDARADRGEGHPTTPLLSLASPPSVISSASGVLPSSAAATFPPQKNSPALKTAAQEDGALR